MFTRRELIKTSFAGAVLLAVGRVAFGPFQSDPFAPEDAGYKFTFLSEKDRSVVLAVSPVMLRLSLPGGSAEREELLNSVIRGVDKAISGLLPNVQDELRDLFNILNFSVTRRFLCGVWKPWLSANAEDVDKFLKSWQKSRFLLLRSGYQALHELITASWYGNPGSWEGIGYEGPPDIKGIL